MSVSFGVYIGPQDLPMDDLRALWREIDAAGMDAISIYDHFYEVPPRGGRSPSFEALTTMTTIAAVTERVRIGCLVLCVPYRNPAALAKSLTTIDHVSHGRLEIGLGAGWYAQEFRAYGYRFPPLGQRMEMLEGAVQIVRSLLTQEETTFAGKHYQLENARCEPPPVQERVPICIGGRGEKRTLRIAARYADSWNAPFVSPQEFGRLNGVLNDWCRKEGRDPAAIERSINVMFYLTQDKSRIDELEEQLRRQWGDAAAGRRLGTILGTLDDAPDLIAPYVAAGAQRINVAVRVPWEQEALRIYMREVVPAMRRRFANAGPAASAGPA